MLNNVNTVFSPQDELLRRIVFLEDQLRFINNYLNGFYVLGRLRTDRSAPTASNDVQAPDLLYDRVLSPSYEYILIDNSGTLEWRRITLSSF